MATDGVLKRGFGFTAGRLAPAGWTPPDGTRCFVLGSDVEGQTGDFSDGDYITISQAGPVAAGDYVTVRVRVRCPEIPSLLPNPYHWELRLGINLGVRVIRILPSNRTRDLVDVTYHIGDLAPSPPDRDLQISLVFVGNPGDIYRDVEIPAVYLDNVEIQSVPSRMVLLSRDPEPSETGVPGDSLVALDIIDSAGVGVDLTKTKVWINGALAYDGAGFVSPFDGPLSAWTTSYVFAERLTFDYTAGPFASESAVTVEVESETTDGLATLVDSYSFTIEDYTDPTITSAAARTQRIVRVTFNEAMTMSDPSGAADALNPSNYALFANEVPAFVPNVSSVSAVSPTEVDLTLDDDLSFERSYRVTASGHIEDVSGNQVSPLGNFADFTSPGTGFPASRRFDLWRMIPQMNRKEDDDGTGDLRKLIECLQEITDFLLADIDDWTEILDLDLAPEDFVDAILYDLGNPFDFDLTADDKRRLGKVLISIYRQKGTARGIENAVLFFLGLVVTVEAFLDPPLWVLGVSELGVDTILGPGTSRDRYTFDVVSGIALTAEQRDQITKIARYMKCAHEHLGRIVEPSAAPDTFWSLGESELGVDTTLAE